MKISSNFHDYYDSLRSQDQDDDPLYVRLTRNISLAENVMNRQDEILYRREIGTLADRQNSYPIHGRTVYFRAAPSWIENRVIGFCGRVYPFLTVGYGKTAKHAFTPERARRLVQEYRPIPETPDVTIDYKELSREKTNLLASMDGGFNQWDNHFQFSMWGPLLLNNNMIGDNSFRHFRTPVLMVEIQNIVGMRQGLTMVVNPNLRQVDFAQVFNPPQAYQELSMYIGNNLAGMDRIEPKAISDKLRSETKGFDKWSFKNQKNRKVSDRGDW